MSLKNLYKFRGNANDYVGSNNGTLGGASSPTNVSGYFSGTSAYSMTGDNGTTDGNRQRIVFDKNTFSYAYNTPFSLNIWLKMSWTGMTNNAYIFFTGQSITNGSLEIESRNDEKIRWFFRTSDGDYVLFYSNTSMSGYDNKWVMITSVYDGTDTLTVYINGIYDNSASMVSPSGNFYSASAQTVLGCRFITGTDYDFDITATYGLLANYDHALSATEVRNLYKETRKTIHS